jgi:hypothetical protein
MAITGYGRLELESTGLVDSHRSLLESILGTKLSEDFHRLADVFAESDNVDSHERLISEVFSPSPVFEPIISSLETLWYLGYWPQLPDDWYAASGLSVPGPNDPGRTHTPSALAYIEQLSYRTAKAHPPSVKPTGFGSWGLDPA